MKAAVEDPGVTDSDKHKTWKQNMTNQENSWKTN